MSTKKDFLYQLIIAVLLLLVAFAFYKLYQPKKVETYKEVQLDVAKSTNIKSIKNKYEVVELKELHNLKLKKIPKLEQKLVKLNESMQETLKMVEEYNFENPDAQIDLDIDTEIPFFSKRGVDVSSDIQDAIAIKQQSVESYTEHYGLTDEKGEEKHSDTSKVASSESNSNKLTASGGGGGSAATSSNSSGSFGSSSFILSQINGVETSTETVTTAYNSVDSDLKKYNSSIVELQGLMSQISSNLE